jgi:hypothetical protein
VNILQPFVCLNICYLKKLPSVRIKTGIRLSSINGLWIYCYISWMCSVTVPLHSVSPAAGKKDGIVSTVMKLLTGKLKNHTIHAKDIRFLFPSIQAGFGTHPDCLLFAVSPGKKPCPNAGLSTTNSTRTDLRGNTDRHSDWQVTDCPSYGRVLSIVTLPLHHGNSSVIQEVDNWPIKGHSSTEMV